jgi:peptidyl-prolyl cis-trans isomerase B (cyclophilin B)
MSPSRRPGRRVPPKARSLRSDWRPDSTGDAAEREDLGTGSVGGPGVRPGSRAANRAAKRSVTGVRPKTQGRSGGRRRSSSNMGLIILAVGAVAIAAAVLLFGNPFGSPIGQPTAGPGLIVGDGTCPTTQPAPLAAGETRTVTITTPKGDIVLKVDGSLSPIAAGNFVALITCHFYDGSVFQRTASLGPPDNTPFVIQGGGAKKGSGEIAYTIKDEPVTATYKRGTLAMARSSQVNSQSSQFFIVLDDKAAPALVSYNTYAIFGEVISGMEVADAIFQASGGVEAPTNPIPMTRVVVGPGPAPTASPATTTPTTGPSKAASPAASPAASTAPTTAP